ncbi:pancreatic secretory granule membrane major glycoprotein GP2-like [Mobula hypostoma]|uniref:pancreatic secretory granule membrane major glycoprotein GP2-like n=1 Tax=Mobula hypostoma TaxID=723540 RepID=UPI002FC35F30
MSPAELRVVLLILGFLVTDSALGDPCVNHTVLDQPWRSTDCSNTECTGGQWMDDRYLAVGWYRFNSSGGWKIPDTIVPEYRCSGYYPGWIRGPHPNVGEGEVNRTVCFTWSIYTCSGSREIRVKNCSGYFVYWLGPAPWSNAVYCTGSHPNVEEGEVTRTVCFTWSIYTCSGSREIRVKNCSGYFVYWLGPAPWSNAVYCTGRSPFPSDTAVW